MDDLNDLYQQVILDHSRSPRNFRALPDANRTAQGHNPLCGDNVTLYLRCEGDVIREITFQGSGCAISKASASILTECLQGRTKQEVEALFERVRAMLTTGQAGGDDLGKLSIFAGVHKFPARVKCAILSWHAVLAALEGKSDPVSTEEGGA
ncbi:MAG: SUF system NifU family Fe-S cluster assembly protein [Verrucomicrobia bacterium]|nr:SUF system NifU family Fe-S cluster assembly protein [Verrucomicrobiota bacterium]MDI9379742.1 SUF system NifU family Fe-S cluster assembly protein [Verrucomicrobiota bacterium]NMD19765.1 SUF system NifU family Fe-S cluster assembly protein [Verrucomicrobiota bacterium]HOA61982.1 SUF system NifU family Fe-S cluster assembly protein [Verrucomicrobiota bacterium]HOF48743.1 SUF system NifU family Fe-S cluster assembly protein [Verrucomicrobiota bacterium]